MAPSSTVELAKKGDPKAIAALMNKSLGTKGVTASATRQGNFLEIILQSQRPLNQKTMVEIVQKGMGNLQVSVIERVLIRSQQGNIPNWESEIVLNNFSSQSLNDSETLSTAGTESDSVNSSLNAAKPRISQAIQTAETRVPLPPEPVRPQNSPPITPPINPSGSASGLVLLPRLSQLNRSVQKYQDTVIRLTDDTGTDIICLCTLAELIRTLYAPTPSHQSIADAIHKCSSTNGDGEKIIRNVSILQPGQMWQKTQIRCTLQIAFEMDGASNLAEDTTPTIATEDTLLEYPSNQTEDGGDATIIESIAPQRYDTPKTEDELLLEELQQRYGRLSSPELADQEDKTIIEAISPAKIQEYGGKPAVKVELAKADSKSVQKLDNSLDSSDDLFDNITSPMSPARPQPEADILFNDFVFDATNPPKMINDIDTISDPTVPPPPQDNLSFTLEDFRSDLLTLV